MTCQKLKKKQAISLSISSPGFDIVFVVFFSCEIHYIVNQKSLLTIKENSSLGPVTDNDINFSYSISDQAFCLPVIQIVHETVRDALSGKNSRPASSAAPSTGKIL